MRVFWLTLSTKFWVTLRAILGKRSRIVSALGVLAAIAFAIALAVPTYMGIAKLFNSPNFTSDELFEFTSLGSCMWLFMLLIISNSDVFMAHTMDLGQRTKDVEFLQTLPLSFSHFFYVKVIERAITDLFSIGLLLPIVLAVSAGVTNPLFGIPLGLIVFSLSQITASAFLVAFQFTLTRFFPLSTLKSIVNWLSLLGMIFFFGLPILIVDYELLEYIPSDFLKNHWFDFIPTTWFAGALSYSSREPMKALLCLIGCFVTALASLYISYCCTALFRRIGWSYSTAGKKVRQFKGWSRWFTGYVWKELLMLRRDKNILVNGILLPVFMTGFVLHNWSTIGWVKGDSAASILAIVSMGLLYFHLFGAINAVGTEGRAIGLLAMIPLSPSRFLALKAIIWGTLGTLLFETFFLTYLFVVAPPILNLYHVILCCLWLFFLSYLLASLGVALSVHFVNYEAKFLQQASTLPGKTVMLLFSIRAVYALSMKEWIPATKSLIFLCLFICAVFYKAVRQLEYPHETVLKPKNLCPLADSMLILFLMGLVGPVITMAVNALFYENNSFTSSSLIALSLVNLLGALFALYHFSRRHKEMFASLGLKPGLFSLAAAAFGGLTLGYLARGYQGVLPRLGIPMNNTNLVDREVYLYIGTVCLIVPICEEIIVRGFIHRGLQKILGKGRRAVLTSALFFALLHPYPSMPPVYLLGIALAVLYDKSSSLTACIFFHIVYNVIVSVPYLAPALYF